ncbi:MAG: hypothetical protein R3A11_01775 [Bdellovibrionota bacterium]
MNFFQKVLFIFLSLCCFVLGEVQAQSPSKKVDFCGCVFDIDRFPRIQIIGEHHDAEFTGTFWDMLIDNLQENHQTYIFMEGALKENSNYTRIIKRKFFPNDIHEEIFPLEESFSYGIAGAIRTYREMKQFDLLYSDLVKMVPGLQFVTLQEIQQYAYSGRSPLIKSVLENGGGDALLNYTQAIRTDHSYEVRQLIENEMATSFDKFMTPIAETPSLRQSFVAFLNKNIDIFNQIPTEGGLRNSFIQVFQNYNGSSFGTISAWVESNSLSSKVLFDVFYALVKKWSIYVATLDVVKRDEHAPKNLVSILSAFYGMDFGKMDQKQDNLAYQILVVWRNLHMVDHFLEQLCEWAREDQFRPSISLKIGADHVEDLRNRLIQKLPQAFHDKIVVIDLTK